MRFIAQVSVGLVLGVIPLQAQEAEDREPRLRIEVNVTATIPENETWSEIHSKHFLVVGSASTKDLRDITSDLELLRETFASFFPRVRSISAVPTTVVVFRNDASFRNFRPSIDGTPQDVKGYFAPGWDKHYLVLNGDKAPRDVLRDYTRTLISEAIGPVPLWFQEGLSDYFSTLRVNRYLIGDSRWTRLGNHVDEYDRLLNPRTKLLPIETLFTANEDSPEYNAPAARQVFDAQSWALVHFLVSRPGGLAAAQRFFNLQGEGVPTTSAFRQAFARELRDFEADLVKYIRAAQREHQWSGRMQLLTKHKAKVDKKECGFLLMASMSVSGQCEWWGEDPLPSGVAFVPFTYDTTLVDTAAIPARTLTEPEIWFYRGDLLLHLDRVSEADAYLHRSEDEPPISKVLAARGLVYLRQKKYAEAQKVLSETIAIDPGNYLAHFYQAVAIREHGLTSSSSLSYDELESIHDSLQTVLGIAPHVVDAVEMLAEINTSRNVGPAASSHLLLDALKRYPGRNTIWIALAQNAEEQQQPEVARWLIQRLLQAGAPDHRTRAAATILAQRLGSGPALGAGQQAYSSVELGTGGVRVADIASTASRSRQINGQRLRGVLNNVECEKGLSLVVTANGKIVRLHTDSPFAVLFETVDAQGVRSSAGPVLCGSIPDPGLDVTITYRPRPRDTSIGEPLAIEIQLLQ